ncbi:hypothetical protein Scep_022608 [Stephania cephalantha]|uniref:Uncharacterized protein n=1 Tax=Stephania cephalantha TaxID=152367 RepID=A0AAP0I2U2_9MAGN
MWTPHHIDDIRHSFFSLSSLKTTNFFSISLNLNDFTTSLLLFLFLSYFFSLLPFLSLEANKKNEERDQPFPQAPTSSSLIPPTSRPLMASLFSLGALTRSLLDNTLLARRSLLEISPSSTSLIIVETIRRSGSKEPQ